MPYGLAVHDNRLVAADTATRLAGLAVAHFGHNRVLVWEAAP
jgi:hypothetical protein